MSNENESKGFEKLLGVLSDAIEELGEGADSLIEHAIKKNPNLARKINDKIDSILDSREENSGKND